MQTFVYKDYTALSSAAALRIAGMIKNKPGSVICLASGDTPRLTCQLLVEEVAKQGLDLSRLNFIGLDEWVGVPPDNEGSCHYFFRTQLFEKIRLTPSNIHLFDSMNADLQAECTKMDAAIKSLGGIDLMLVGVGMNGHIGFNEPGVSFDNYAHVTELDETTTTVGQKYFKTPVALSKGITLGLRHLTESREVLMLASGRKKAGIIKAALEGRPDSLVPASIIQTIPQSHVMIDNDAASELEAGFPVNNIP